ncbi:30S ribosomal protein S21, chloroplastic [Andrographis paniculata]|uniref:30S ribosomal protein S21, chloroplastic n=1 Tax=Andrographis paniculata TaxID=175694 RepID=UPI0021E99F82|nr:30S ribosomal protein S21, chloroplastic [Andrographis paniculata]
MASSATSSISTLFSFFSHSQPSPPPKSPPSQVSLSSSQISRDRLPVRTRSSSNEALDSVVCPSLAYANTLFFRTAYNVQVVVDDKEPEERLLGRFRREVMRAGVIQEVKRRRCFETKQDEKKRKTREAAKRNRRRRPQSRMPSPQDRQETSKASKGDDDEDNWDLPDGDDLPYLS